MSLEIEGAFPIPCSRTDSRKKDLLIFPGPVRHLVSLQLEKPRAVPRVALRCDLALAQDRAALASWDGLGLGWNERTDRKI